MIFENAIFKNRGLQFSMEGIIFIAVECFQVSTPDFNVPGGCSKTLSFKKLSEQRDGDYYFPSIWYASPGKSRQMQIWEGYFSAIGLESYCQFCHFFAFVALWSVFHCGFAIDVKMTL